MLERVWEMDETEELSSNAREGRPRVLLVTHRKLLRDVEKRGRDRSWT